MLKLELHELQVLFMTTLVGVGIGALYTHFAYLSQPTAEGTLWLGMGIGGTIGFLITFFEAVFVGRPNSYIRQLPFLISMLVRAGVHLGIIYGTLFCWQELFKSITGGPIAIVSGGLNSASQDLAVSMGIVVLIVFYMQMRLFIGAKTLRNLILGKYNKPREEQQIFMIIDLVGSTAFAQKHGDIVFHEYLNKLFVLMDGPIHRFGGEVHSYVGDAIFAVWPVTMDPTKDARPLEALIGISKVLDKRSEKIAKQFGQKPAIRVAIHKGSVVKGETGYRKRQITYLGNTVNLASRMESLTKNAGQEMLASADFLNSVSLPEGLHSRELGLVEIKGSRKPLQLFSLETQTT